MISASVALWSCGLLVTFGVVVFTKCCNATCSDKTATLTANTSSLVGTFCEGTLELECQTQYLPSLRWYLNVTAGENVTTESHVFSVGTTYPVQVNSPVDGLTIAVTKADVCSSNRDFVNFTSTLTERFSTFSELGSLTVQCGSNDERSNPLVVNISVSDGPPPPTNTTCEIVTDQDGRRGRVTFTWSKEFNTAHSVDYYNLMVSPDIPMATCNILAMVSLDRPNYTCNGLDLATRYVISISAANCGGQEGRADVFELGIAPPDPDISLYLQYDESGLLNTVVVKWMLLPISTRRCSAGIGYMIALEDGLDINQANIDSDSCISDRCSVSFSLTKPVKQVYKLRINSSSVFGESTFQFPETIESNISSLLNFTDTTENCEIVIQCFASIDSIKNCSVKYSDNLSDLDSASSITKPVNTGSFSFMLNVSNTSQAYYIQVNFTADTTIFRFSTEGNYSCMDGDSTKRSTTFLVIIILCSFVLIFLNVCILVLCHRLHWLSKGYLALGALFWCFELVLPNH